MTQKEMSLLERMRDELHEYHGDVRQMEMEIKSVASDMRDVKLDLYGTPGDKEVNPGALDHIKSLIASRKIMRIGIRILWGVVMLVAGALASYIFS